MWPETSKAVLRKSGLRTVIGMKRRGVGRAVPLGGEPAGRRVSAAWGGPTDGLCACCARGASCCPCETGASCLARRARYPGHIAAEAKVSGYVSVSADLGAAGGQSAVGGVFGARSKAPIAATITTTLTATREADRPSMKALLTPSVRAAPRAPSWSATWRPAAAE